MSSSQAFTEPAPPRSDQKPPPLRGDGQSPARFLVAVPSRCSALSRSPTFFPAIPESTTRISTGDCYPSGKTANLWHWFPVAVPGRCSTASSSLAFLSGFLRNPQPLVSAGSRHPSRETTNPGTGFLFQFPIDFLRYLVPRLSQNPQPHISTEGRHSSGETANPWRGFQFPAIPRPTTLRFDQKPPPLRGDGQLSAPLSRY